MTDTVFSPSFGNRPRVLVGREAVMNGLQIGLESNPGSKERVNLIIGQRGSGKTVILLELAEYARNHGYVVASPTVLYSGMLERILEKLTEESGNLLPKAEKVITGGSIGVLGFSAGIQTQTDRHENTGRSFAYRLSRLCDAVNKNDNGVLILVDEVQAGSEELKQLIIAYQEMIGEGRNIAMVLAGLPAAIASTLNDHVLTFLNRATKINLIPLRINEVEAYFRKSFRELNLKISDEFLRIAASETKGSPYLMQLTGHYITLYASDNSGIKTEGFYTALEKAKEDFKNDICGTTLSAVSDKDIAFLKALAEGEGEATVSEIADRLNMGSSYVQTYKRRMIQAGIIEQPRRGIVRFAVPYLHDYLREQDD